MSFSISVDKLPSLEGNLAVYDSHDGEVLFFSGFGYKSHMKEITKMLNLTNKTIYLSDKYYNTGEGNLYETVVTQPSNSDYAHLVAFKKDRLVKDEKSSRDYIEGYVFHEFDERPAFFEKHSIKESLESNVFPEVLIDKVYDKLYALSPVPILKAWIPYLLIKLEQYNKIHLPKVKNISTTKVFFAIKFKVGVQDLQELISTGLRKQEIIIDEENNQTSDTMKDISGLDSYLNEFRDTLAKRIQNSFSARFVPNRDSYSNMLNDLVEYGAYMGDLNLYNAQKDVVQATCNALDKKPRVLIIGEPGVGKTAISTSTVFTHNADKKIMTNIVMCPGHLVEKWKKEIERLAPLSDAVIVENFDQLMSLKSRIKSRHRNRHLWLVISKETAKFGYNERPAAVFSRSAGIKVGHPEGVFCCPECGQPLYSVTYEGRGRYRHAIYHYFGANSFGKKNAENLVCMNKVKKYDRENKVYITVPCNTKLWEAAGKDAINTNTWVNLGKDVGWIMRAHIQSEMQRLNSLEKHTRATKAQLFAYAKAMTEGIPTTPTPIKYPLGRYIHRYFKGYIDYALLDEVHELKGKDSLQAQAFGDLVATAKHSLAFTGTFLNGYSSGAYYILYRMFPGMMKKEGFEFNTSGENKFMHEYGVYKKQNSFILRNGQRQRHGATKEKELPGVSPLVFTKFLLENAVFISLEDIGEGLPGYEEIPVPVQMDAELTAGYQELESSMHSLIKGRYNRTKVLSQAVQMLSIYPDCPYDQPPIIHPDTGEVLAVPRELSKDIMRNKDVELLRIVQEKVNNGEKVLVYYNWVNRTDLGKRLPKFFEDHGISAVTMTSSVKNSDRERWIQEKVVDKDVDVLIVNPSLVETGLDLLDFTTIVFYQVGYNLFTLRQASRRSWRLSQTKDVQVYFLYYQQTVQEQALNLMATKLQAAMAIEGKFTEDGLNAMSNNEDVLTQIAASVADGIKDTVDAQVFSKAKVNSSKLQQKTEDKRMILIDRNKNSLPTTLEKYCSNKKNNRKRREHLKVLGLNERNLLNNFSQLFEAV